VKLLGDKLIGILEDCDNFVLDMDGVLYTGNKPIGGARKTLERLYKLKKNVKYLTNFPYSRETIKSKMKNIVGVEITEEDIMTIAHATAVYLREKGCKNCYLMGLDDLRKELEKNNIKILETEDVIENNKVKKLPNYLVISLYEAEDFYKRLNAAGHILRSEAFSEERYIATSKGFGWTREVGITPGIGCTIAALECFSKGKKPIVIGKPSNIATDLAFRHWNIKPEECVMIGDKWSDIETANFYNSIAIKVETGREDFFDSTEKLEDKFKPKIVLKSINGLFDEKEIIYVSV
jgi:NagD protein